MYQGIPFLTTMLLCLSTPTWSQSDSLGVHVVDSIPSDSVRLEVLDGMVVIAKPSFDTRDDMVAYYTLRRRIIKTYPYAKLAAEKLDSLNHNLSQTQSRRKRRRLIRRYQRFLEERFEPELRRLSVADGAVLFKLVHRETGMTVFQLIRTYKGLGSAWSWAAVARWYDNSIRSEYRPERNAEDREIEVILIRCFQSGALEPRTIYFVE